MKLEDINKENIFKIPDQYFEEFPDRLKSRISEESGKDQGKLVSFPLVVKMAVAASIVVLITFGIFQINFKSKSVDQLLASVPTESLIAYLEESEMSTDELIETMDIGLITQEDDLYSPYIISDEEINEELIEDIMIDYELELQM